MKSLHQRPEPAMSHVATQLARKAEEQEGEDNVVPWLRVHLTLVQAALRGYKVGVQTAIEQAFKHRN